MISVVLPAYERANAVLCALAALDNQTYRDFEVVLIDDSDSDAVERAVNGAVSLPLLASGWSGADWEAVRKELASGYPPAPIMAMTGEWSVEYVGKVRYLRASPPRAGSFTAARARNIGAANARGDLLVFIDQDVMLAPDALQHYANAYEIHGDKTVIVGLYHWLPRMDFEPLDVKTSFLDIYQCGITGELQRFTHLQMDVPGIQGRDMREKDFGDIEHWVDDAALGAFSGNIGYPRKLYLEMGGMDENIRGHGGEDADLGLTAKEHGAKFLLFKDIWGLHRWHSRDQAKNEAEVQENIAYIDLKHGTGRYAGAKKWCDSQEWSDPVHYKKDVGGVLMQIDGNPTVWACRDGHRIGLPTPDWVERLGFDHGQVLTVGPSGLNNYKVEGVAHE